MYIYGNGKIMQLIERKEKPSLLNTSFDLKY